MLIRLECSSCWVGRRGERGNLGEFSINFDVLQSYSMFVINSNKEEQEEEENIESLKRWSSITTITVKRKQSAKLPINLKQTVGIDDKMSVEQTRRILISSPKTKREKTKCGLSWSKVTYRPLRRMNVIEISLVSNNCMRFAIGLPFPVSCPSSSPSSSPSSHWPFQHQHRHQFIPASNYRVFTPTNACVCECVWVCVLRRWIVD